MTRLKRIDSLEEGAHFVMDDGVWQRGKVATTWIDIEARCWAGYDKGARDLIPERTRVREVSKEEAYELCRGKYRLSEKDRMHDVFLFGTVDHEIVTAEGDSAYLRASELVRMHVLPPNGRERPVWRLIFYESSGVGSGLSLLDVKEQVGTMFSVEESTHPLAEALAEAWVAHLGEYMDRMFLIHGMSLLPTHLFYRWGKSLGQPRRRERFGRILTDTKVSSPAEVSARLLSWMWGARQERASLCDRNVPGDVTTTC